MGSHIQIGNVFAESDDNTSHFAAQSKRWFQRTDPPIQHSISRHNVVEIDATSKKIGKINWLVLN